MHSTDQIDLSHFFIAGINYRKTDAALRGVFAVNSDQYERLFPLATASGIRQFFVLSTCNRTEIYGFADHVDDLQNLLISQAEASAEIFNSISYIRQGADAINHLFEVAAGLDSQILGDYEIVGQIKQAAKFSKQHGYLSAPLERLINEVLQASKRIRTTTCLSSGTVSVSFAAVQYIRSHFADFADKKILLVGTGKFGSNTCKNLADYLPGSHVTLLNRTVEKAEELAAKYHFNCRPIEELTTCINNADIILVATSADAPFILKEHFCNGNKLVIDLSVPCNVAADISEIAGITLVNVDELSRIKDDTLVKRAAEIPKAKKIICEHINAFLEWNEMRKHVPVLKAVKNKLLTIQSGSIVTLSSCIPLPISAEDHIQKVINGMAVKMKTSNERGCNFIEAINDFISPSTN